MNNLLSNALKFTLKGDYISVKVSQIEVQSSLMYKVVVADTGIGMSKEFLSRLFTPYQQEVRFGDRKIFGTGLGISITKKLVSRMCGQIMVESMLGKGSVFTLMLPFETAAKEEKDVLKSGNLQF